MIAQPNHCRDPDRRCFVDDNWCDRVHFVRLRRKTKAKVIGKSTSFECSHHPLTFFFHASLKALAQATVTTLISLVLVDDAISREATCIRLILSHTATKESFATITAGRTVMLPGGPIPTNRASAQRLHVLQRIIVGSIVVVVVIIQQQARGTVLFVGCDWCHRNVRIYRMRR